MSITDSRPATVEPLPNLDSPAGHQRAAHSVTVLADHLPGDQGVPDTHVTPVAGEQHPSVGRPAAQAQATPADTPVLADLLLAFAADVLTDLEKVRIANENRLRQLTRSAADKDGEVRGFGLDESHPDVARLAALVGMLSEAEHKATLNLGRLMRQHPLGPWVASMRGVGEKQGARLLAAIGDPYIRPEIVRADGTVEPSRPRKVSELWALCGYHVIKIPVSGQLQREAHAMPAADGSHLPAGDQIRTGAQYACSVGGDQDSHPGQAGAAAHGPFAGVAPKRARGQKANWSATAKMRAFLIAESCVKQPAGSRYRDAYDAARAKYADAMHAAECVRCGPKGKPALPGSPISPGHQHARALRAVAKEVLKDLWREAKRIHEELPVSGHSDHAIHELVAADGDQP